MFLNTGPLISHAAKRLPSKIYQRLGSMASIKEFPHFAHPRIILHGKKCKIWPWLTLVTFGLLLFWNRETYQKSIPIYLLASLILGLCVHQIWYSLVHSHLRSMGYKITSEMWAGKISWIVSNSAMHCQVYWNLISGPKAAAEWVNPGWWKVLILDKVRSHI